MEGEEEGDDYLAESSESVSDSETLSETKESEDDGGEEENWTEEIDDRSAD